MSSPVRIKSISHLHQLLGLNEPKHPLISLIDAKELEMPEEHVGSEMAYDFYAVSLKDKSCGLDYGRNSLDYDEGVLTFSSPDKAYRATRSFEKGEIDGWMLVFHTDLIEKSQLGGQIRQFGFFNYDLGEALHLSVDEEETITRTVQNIAAEYEQRIDAHSLPVILSNLELLLNYSKRFYERQFNTRATRSQSVVEAFIENLSDYFSGDLHLEEGLPSIKRFSDGAGLSQHYFSDLLKKETGRSAKDHINDFVIEKAKHLLLSTTDSINEIAYDLGFNYPHYFTRLFKSKTGSTPLQFRELN